MNSVINILTKLGLLKDDLDYHLIRYRWSSYFCSLVIRNGSSTKRRH